VNWSMRLQVSGCSNGNSHIVNDKTGFVYENSSLCGYLVEYYLRIFLRFIIWLMLEFGDLSWLDMIIVVSE